MANGRGLGKGKKASGRDPGAFMAIPLSVIESKAYVGLSHTAKALLFELARQYRGDDNGRLLLSRKSLAARGWKSPEVIQRARDQLIGAGFVYVTVTGHRPNKASWYAVTWQTLDKIPGFDPDRAEAFVRSAYRDPLSPTRQKASTPPVQGGPSIGTPPVLGEPSASTAPVPIRPQKRLAPCSPAVHPLDMPSAGVGGALQSLPSDQRERASDSSKNVVGLSLLEQCLTRKGVKR